MSIQLRVQKGIYDVLTKHEKLKSKVSGVFDHVPDNKKFPFVTIGDDNSEPWETKTFKGESVTHTIHCWSKEKGKLEVKEVMAEVRNAMASFHVEGFEDMDLVVSESFKQDEIQHGVVRYEIRVKEV